MNLRLYLQAQMPSVMPSITICSKTQQSLKNSQALIYLYRLRMLLVLSQLQFLLNISLSIQQMKCQKLDTSQA
jgi:hypothetical protein